MDENLELEQEIDEAFAEIEEVDTDEVEDLDDTTDASEDDEDGAEDGADDGEDEMLEYDEDGNVIVAEEDETVVEEPATEVDAETKPDEQTGAEDKASTDVKDTAEYGDLKKKHDDRESLIKDVLKIVGIDEADIDQGLAKLAAETEGVTVDEFLKNRAEKQKAKEAQEFYNKMLLDRKVAKDVSELHAAFPETKGITKFEDIPNAHRYAQLRDLGLSVTEAYNAANPEGRRNAIVNSVKQQPINASKSHLKSNVPIASKDTSVKISRAEMESMRDLFPDKSDKEIIALYKKTK